MWFVPVAAEPRGITIKLKGRMDDRVKCIASTYSTKAKLRIFRVKIKNESRKKE